VSAFFKRKGVRLALAALLAYAGTVLSTGTFDPAVAIQAVAKALTVAFDPAASQVPLP
jgi:hypothetical protein